MNIIARMNDIFIVQCGWDLPGDKEQWWNVYSDESKFPLKTHWELSTAFEHLMELIK